MDKTPGKKKGREGRRHIDTMKPYQIHGLFDDDGYEITLDMIPKPPMCLICLKESQPEEEIYCNLNRYDQREKKEFKCYAFEKMPPLK